MKITKRIMGNENRLPQKAVFWNTSASILNAGMSAFLLLVVSIVLGSTQSGIFGFGFSIAQMMLAIGLFDMRPYQVTDLVNPTEFKYYFTSRVITLGIMILASIGFSVAYVMIKEDTLYKCSVMILLCLLKGLEAIEDVFHGMLQVKGRLDAAGKLQSYRLIITMVSFSLGLVLTKDIPTSCILSLVISFLFIVMMNVPVVKLFTSIKLDFNYKILKNLFAACMPLFIGSFLGIFLENAPKFAIDSLLTENDQSIYQVLFMPSFIINLCSTVILRPLLTPLAVSWNADDKKRYRGIILKLLGGVCLLTICAVAGAYWLGIPILSTIYRNIKVDGYRNALVILMLGGGISAAGTVLYYALTVMRKQRYILIGHGVSAVLALFISYALVQQMQLFGASLSYLLLITIRVTCFLIVYIIFYQRSKHRTCTLIS